MLNIIADDKIPFLEGVLEPYANISYRAGKNTTADVIKEADALITRTRTYCNAHTLGGSKVKMIATATVGFDHIDTNFCEQNNIAWKNAPGCNSGSVKQYIAAVLATLTTKFNIDLSTKTLGIIGVGNVGSKVKDLAEGIGMKVLLNDPPRAQKEGHKNFVELNQLLQEADIITFHVPLNKEGEYPTFHMGNQTSFEQCKKGVIVINSSRGEVVSGQHLLQNMISGRVEKAILDVWENEPNIDSELLDKVAIATPHIAGYSLDGKALGTAMSVNAISKHFGLPLNNWFPSALPEPERPVIKLSADLPFRELWSKAVLHTYNILNDHIRLKENRKDFERLRGSYPVRREFQAYTLQLTKPSGDTIKRLNKIGFVNVEVL